jgi:putative phosphoribosyl transferase
MATQTQVKIPPMGLEGDLVVPPGATGLVLFAHGSGSSRHSSRNQFVAKELQWGGLATLLFDLLTAAEEEVDAETAHLRFDIPLLAARLVNATEWIERDRELSRLPIGYFGASTGAAAALSAAAEMPEVVLAVVSRGGRPDLAGDALRLVVAPTLLIVGGNDDTVIGLNQIALQQIVAEEKQLKIIPGATHLFEEPGALEAVAVLARDWFTRHLVKN